MERCRLCGRAIDAWKDNYTEIDMRIQNCENGRVVDDTHQNFLLCSYCKVVLLRNKPFDE